MKKLDLTKLSVVFSERSLCTRCGTCVGICPVDALSIDHEFYPKLNADVCTECGLCAKTCPGGKVDFTHLSEITFGNSQNAAGFDGHVQKTLIGHAGDPRIRQGGAGGGIITALMWDLLQNHIVDGCIVTRINPNRPWHGEVFIARTYEDLLASQQSKYIIIPANAIFQIVKDLPGRYALAAMPCQVHGYRLMAERLPAIRKKIHIVIGLFCASSLEPFVAEEMLQMRGIPKAQIKNFHFRGGSWPGKIRAIMNDGQIKPLHYSNFKDGAINYLTLLYSPFRCQTCIDGSAEFADISVSDAWTRDSSGNYVFQSQSKLLLRTDIGVQIAEQAIANGTLIAQDVSGNQHFQTHRLHTRKKGLKSPLRTARLLAQGKKAPLYDRQPPKSTWQDRLGERLESFIMALGRRRATRYPLFNLLTSRYGILLVKIRQWNKGRKYKGKK
ncbi:MAG TPA: Coenzyme F420 hydrogenase/dehydrogenase, beta subunit C-terminal domain [bacterium]|nr:Coenzyme F420 hydrogenase/dehydrogenase, beta subunit C-terminal domain [bacterium]HNT64492.1 Coenzyme F420 hydrogenase/dehydrogenase, beta subunit C-terminal domain [bacterium]